MSAKIGEASEWIQQASSGSLALHDDRCVVTETVLEHQLELVRAVVLSPVGGVFGPESMMWRVHREAVIFLAAGRALLLQLAHPWVAAGVANHSQALADPIGRFHRTFYVVFALVFGTVDQAFSAARRLHRRHSSVSGTMQTTVGPFKEGSSYSADNISALRWVYATLIESALVAHDLVLRPLACEERERYYAETHRFAALFGIPRNFLPADWNAFTSYSVAMKQSDILTVSPAAREIAGLIFAGSGMWFPIPKSYRALTLQMLPERLRQGFGFIYGERERRVAERATHWIRSVYSVLPAGVRYVGPYQEALARLAGRAPIDRATRLSNRFWIGRPLLGGD